MRLLLLLIALALPSFVAAAPAEAAETVRVRFGDHDGFSRAVFDWPKPVGYRLVAGEGHVDVVFGRRAHFDLSELHRIGPKAITAARPLDDGMTVRLVVGNGEALKSFPSGRRVVVDIAGRAGVARWIGEEAPAAAEQRPEPVAAEPTGIVGRRETHAMMAPAPHPTEIVQPLKVAAKATEEPRSVPTPANAVPVSYDFRPGRTIVRFRWPEPVAAAALHRGQHVWLAFDRDRPIDPKALVELADGPVERLRHEPSPSGTVVRLDVAASSALAVTADGRDWIVDVGGARGRADRSVVFEAQADSSSGPRIFAPVAGAGQPITIYDPLVGDRLALVPLKEAGLGVRPERRYVLFELPATPQGIAVRFKGEDLDIDVGDAGLTIGGRNTLHLAAEAQNEQPGDHPPALSPQAAAPAGSKELAFDFAAWAGKGDLETLRHDLLYRIAMASPSARNAERQALARLLLAHGLAHEALGVMARIDAQDRHADTDATYRALRGVAHLLAGHLAEAATDLRDPAPQAADVALFRGLLAAKRREFDDARVAFKDGMTALPSLPDHMRPKLRLAIAETALALNDHEMATHQVEELLRPTGNEEHRDEGRLLAARVDAMTGDTEDAVAKFAELAESDNRAVRAKAAFAEANVLLADERIDVAEALERLEKLRFAWRGDIFEFDVMRRLGELYIEAGDYRQGLTTMRQTIDRFPELPEAQRLAGEMNDIFAGLFEGEVADRMSPVTAMGLYYEFRELTPGGERGDQMIRGLADRLASVELLDEAAKLLEHQVRHRLNGIDKSRIGARLAVLYLLDGRPDDAIEALRITRGISLPEELTRERLLLEARGLTEAGRYDRALAMLDNLDGQEVDEVRTEILWRSRQWSRAATSLAKRLVELRQSDKPLEQAARRDILRYAIASSLAGDRLALSGLRDDFAERMEGQPEWPAFQVVTAEDRRDTAEFRNLAAEIAQVDRFESFMAAYRERLRAAPLSAIN